MAYSILIVDDSEIIRSMIARTISLSKLPVQIFHQAQNGQKAIEILGKEWIDIVFTDLNMPIMNGFDLISKMNKSVELNDIPVIVVTTEGNVDRLNELRNIGARECLRKPFTPEQIRDTITSILGVWNE